MVAPHLMAIDSKLFSQGNHHQIYRKLGAHPVTLEGDSGTMFAVWAPNAKQVSIVVSFNHWHGRNHPMQKHAEAGIWELFIPEAQTGDLYKYQIKAPDDQIIFKSDPFGFAMEKRPSTASIVSNLAVPGTINKKQYGLTPQRGRGNLVGLR